MRFAVVTLGSLGDVLPFLAIAKELVRRGHDVELLSNPRFEALVRQHGVRFYPIGSERDADRTEAHPDLWHPVRGLGVLWRHLVAPALKPSLARIEALSRAEDGRGLTVLASPLALGARVARELLPIRLVTGYTAPMTLRSTSDPMFVGAWRVPERVPRFARHAIWQLVDKLKLHPMLRASLLDWRCSLGLAPIEGSVFGRWMPSPDGGLALFPSWFASDDDWPAVHACGFPLLDEPGPLSSELTAFLDAGPAPVVVYPGSGSRHTSGLLARALDAITASGSRAVLLSRHVDQTPEIQTRAAIVQTEVPFHLLLPQAALLVHHGGIGSCAQAIRAGIPQVILPAAYDQFDNAARTVLLGLGVMEAATEFSVESMKIMLENALRPEGKRRAAELGETFTQRDVKATSLAANWLECAG